MYVVAYEERRKKERKKEMKKGRKEGTKKRRRKKEIKKIYNLTGQKEQLQEILCAFSKYWCLGHCLH